MEGASMTGITLGRYVPYKSFLHKMDARAKLFCYVLLLAAIFLSFKNYSTSFLFSGFLLLITVILLLASRVSIAALFKSLASLWFFVVFLLVVYILVPSASYTHVAFKIGDFPFYWESILEALRILLRLMLMVALSMVLTSSTKPLELTGALEWYMYPLKVVGIPSHVIAMIITLALRFIPTILDDVERIMKAQASRGVDFKHGNLKTKFYSLVSLFIPLFATSLLRSEELADAMECRGYDPKAKRTRYRQIHFHLSDLLWALLASGILSLFIAASVLHFDPFMSFWGLSVL